MTDEELEHIGWCVGMLFVLAMAAASAAVVGLMVQMFPGPCAGVAVFYFIVRWFRQGDRAA